MTARNSHRALLWAVVCGGLIMGAAIGTRHVQGLFLVPMTMERGWSRETFGFALAMQNLLWGVAQPFTGMIADRFGCVRVIVGGAVLYAAGLVLMSVATTPTGLTLSAGLLVGIALSCTSFGVIYGALSRIVAPEQRSRALGAAGAVAGLGQFLMVPLTQGLQSWLGWTSALVVLGLGIAVLAPLAATLKDADSESTAPGPKQSMGEAIREAFRHRGFWLLNLGFLACGFQLAFIGSHLPAYLLDKGLSASEGVAALAIIALANVAGTYCFGHLGGLYRRKHLLSGLYVLRSAAMALFVLLPLSPASVYVFAAVMGWLWLGTVPLTNGIVSQVFGVRYITTLFGFVFLGHQFGAFLGVWLGGFLFDATGSYELVWLGSIGLGLVAAALHWPIDDREIVRPAALGMASAA